MKKIFPLQLPLPNGLKLDKEYINIVFEIEHPKIKKTQIKIEKADNILDIVGPLMNAFEKISVPIFIEEICLNEDGLSIINFKT